MRCVDDLDHLLVVRIVCKDAVSPGDRNAQYQLPGAQYIYLGVPILKFAGINKYYTNQEELICFPHAVNF
jgi:hypothetical protein